MFKKNLKGTVYQCIKDQNKFKKITANCKEISRR